MLPESNSASTAAEAKFADTAVPALLKRVLGKGALRSRLEAVLVGGAQMFALGGGNLDIGVRNERATRKALDEAGIPVRAAATSGNKGRTIKVHVGEGAVTVREAGGAEMRLLEAL
jgi:chemotaxis protein CheD